MGSIRKNLVENQLAEIMLTRFIITANNVSTPTCCEMPQNPHFQLTIQLTMNDDKNSLHKVHLFVYVSNCVPEHMLIIVSPYLI